MICKAKGRHAAIVSRIVPEREATKMRLCKVFWGFLAITIIPLTVSGARLQVNPNDPAAFQTIQAAINAANPGDIITISPGIYEERLTIEKSLTLMGPPEGATSVKGHIVIKKGTVNLLNLKLLSVRFHSEISIEGGDIVSIKDCDLEDTYIIVRTETMVNVSHCMFHYGGVLMWRGEPHVTVTNCTFYENKAGNYRYAPIYSSGRSEVQIFGTTVQSCSYTVVIEEDSQVHISKSTIRNCRDGVTLAGNARLELSGSTIEGVERNGLEAWENSHVAGTGNHFKGNGCDLVGNVPPEIRVPLREPTKEVVLFPSSEYSTLQEAVDALIPGGTLILQGGVYENGVTIDKEVEIGSVDAEDIFVGVFGEFKEEEVKKGEPVIEGLVSLIGEAKLNLRDITLKRMGLVVGRKARASLSLWSCKFDEADVRAFGAVQLQVRNCSFVQGGDVYLGGTAQAELSSCTFIGWRELLTRALAERAIYIGASARAKATRITIEGYRTGISLEDTSSLEIRGGSIDTIWGLKVSRDAEAVIRSVLFDCWDTGVTVHGGKATLERCIFQGGENGVKVWEGSATIYDSLFYENQVGLRCKQKGKVEIEGCVLTKGRLSGVILRGGECRIASSVLAQNDHCGVEHWEGSLEIENSTICQNGYWGIFSLSGEFNTESVVLDRNKLGKTFIRARALYLDSTRSISERIEDLLSKMPLEEKAAQLDILADDAFWEGRGEYFSEGIGVGSVLVRLFGRPYYDAEGAAERINELQEIAIEHTYLGIPVLIATDCPLGASVHGATVFPAGIAMASTWDPDLIQTVGSVIATESRSMGVHQTYSPVVDICRDPRWGRVEESLGEDPYLASVMAAAMVRGLQGEGLNTDHTVIATPKHFVAYGRVLGGRNGSFESVSERELREIYLPPFEAAVKGGAKSIMAAYSELNGVPIVSSNWLLNKVLREEWDFDGFVVTDWECIEDLFRVFKVAIDFEDAVKQALLAGVDLHMLDKYGTRDFQDKVVELVRRGKLSEQLVDEAVKRVLQIKFALGLFDHPFADPARAAEIVGSEEHREVALQAARESIVLLKNEGNLLPFSKEIGSVAFVDLNDSIDSMLGWGYDWMYWGMTVFKAVQQKVPPENVHDISEWELERSLRDPERYPKPLETIKEADAAIVVAGEPGDWTGETWPDHERDRASLQLPEGQLELIKAIHETGTPTVVVILSGRPLPIGWLKDHVPAILWAWKPGPVGGQAIADVLFGDYNPSGKLPISFPYNVGQIPVFYNWHPYTRRTHYTEPYIPARPLFPFGHGLSYTKFEYSNLTITPEEIELSDDIKIRISVDVQNVGDREGTEVVQLYLRDVVASVVRPVMELKGFKRVTLRPGEKKTTNFILPYGHLAFYNRDMVRVIEPGTFEVMIGSSPEDIRLTGSFEVRRGTPGD